MILDDTKYQCAIDLLASAMANDYPITLTRGEILEEMTHGCEVYEDITDHIIKQRN